MRSDRVTWALVVVLMLGAIGLGLQEVTSEILPGGSEAPPFLLERFEGGSIELTKLRGKVVVINFWATWCPPCREEMPYLVKLVKESPDVELVAISNDDLDDQKAAVALFVKGFPELTPYVALGRPEVGFVYHVEALPSVYVLDRKGRLVASHQGQASEAQLRRWISKALDATN